ncbi:hypothetical protein GGX14DRAFT_569348 [Mycena pura]|uniref:Uncharacterized protein n=1 Tax=Mycena pura TaxID=153505 RepID=A0AAD6VB76_9AGAR|nr:hypothetical protein GGX14DRAFT_569348 [Mycena pura]
MSRQGPVCRVSAQGTHSRTFGPWRHKKGWTFRRIGSLRLWAGALKIRYLLPIVVPPQPGTDTASSSTPPSTPASPQRFYVQQPPVMLDAKAIAREDPRWDDLLET